MKQKRKQKNNKIFLGLKTTLISLAVTVLIGGGGVVLWRYWKASGIGIKESKETVEDQTTDWKTYESKERGFKIKYPPDYFISTTESLIEIASNKWEDQYVHHPYVSIQTIETTDSLDDWVAKTIQEMKDGNYGLIEEGCQMHCVSAVAEEVIIGNDIRSLKYSIWGVSGGGDDIAVKKGDDSNKIFLIHDHIAGGRDPGEESVPKEVLDKMLASFRFIE